MVKRAAVLLALAHAACTDEATVEPVIDVPSADDPDADAFANLDDIVVTIANEGSDRDLVSHTFARGEQLSLPGAPFGENLVIHMNGFVGASTVAYGRTCAFAVGAGLPPAEPHLFFSRTVKFASLPLTLLPRFDGRALAYNGRAIFLGGKQSKDGAALTEVEQFDPSSGRMTQLEPVRPREGAVEALIGLSPQRIVVLGGTVDGVGARFYELLEPGHLKVTLEDSTLDREGMTATSLTDGRVIAIGGNEPTSPPVGKIVELVDRGTFVDIRDLRAVLTEPRTGHTATRLGDDVGAPVLIAGGTNGINGFGPPIAKAELFKPLSEELSPLAPNMIVPRSHHQAVLMPDGSVLIIGGVDSNQMPALTLERFTLDAGFVDVGLLPNDGASPRPNPLAGIVDFTATTLPDGRILLTGGRLGLGGPPIDKAYIARVNPLDGKVDVVATDHLAFPRANHQAALLCDGTVLISGGENDVPPERYNPPAAGRR